MINKVHCHIANQTFPKLFIAACLALGLTAQPAQAILLKGSGDPACNTTAPTGTLAGSGWQYQGQWGGFLGTVIAPQYFIAARHVGGSIGQEYVLNGVTYHTTAYWDDATTDLRIWKVDGVFANYATLYSTSDETGKSLVVIGRGTQRGDEVRVPTAQTVYTTNVVNLKTLGISTTTAKKEFPGATFKGSIMTAVTSDVVTNLVLKGWAAGVSDGVMRWGQNTVSGAGNMLVASFDMNGTTNEATLSGGDSSGAVFIQSNGAWKLAGINYGIEGPFAVCATDACFYGAIFNEGGLYVGGSYVPDDGQQHPSCFYATRISPRVAWIQSIIKQ
jgi:hypothetical protein